MKLALEALDKDAPVRRRCFTTSPFPYRRESEFTQLLESFKIDICVYGHLHRNGGHRPFR